MTSLDNDYMLGLVAVGVVVVDAPPGDPAHFSDFELSNALMGIWLGINELDFLAQTKGPGGRAFSFLVNLERVQIQPTSGLKPPTGDRQTIDADIADREPHWRDEALQALNLPKGAAGVDQHNRKLRARAWPGGLVPRWAFTTFLTKFHTGWPAYASRARVTMQVEWLSDASGNFNGTNIGGYGPFGLDRVFAHEACHIFGVADEHALCNAKEIDAKPQLENGFQLVVPNSNCGNGNKHVPCLMDKNVPELCPSTLASLGWIDLDQGGEIDFLHPAIIKVHPRSGPAGTTIRVQGLAFNDTHHVKFISATASVPATFTVTNDRELIVEVPQGTGQPDIVVQTFAGASDTSADTHYSYPP